VSTRVKVVSAIVLVILSAGVWIPQIAGMGGDGGGVAYEELPAEAGGGVTLADEGAFSSGDEATGVTSEETASVLSEEGFTAESDSRSGSRFDPRFDPSGESSPASPPESSVGSPAGDPEPFPSLVAIEHTLDSLETFAPRAGSESLASLLEELRTPEVASEGESHPLEDICAAIAPSTEHADRLAEFTEENPLSGILYGDDLSMALVGHRIVREGDRLAGGMILVLEIGPDWVSLGSGEEEILIDLPPFVARASSSEGEESELEEEGAAGEVTSENEISNSAPGGA
jgi:hypothetical protein